MCEVKLPKKREAWLTKCMKLIYPAFQKINQPLFANKFTNFWAGGGGTCLREERKNSTPNMVILKKFQHFTWLRFSISPGFISVFHLASFQHFTWLHFSILLGFISAFHLAFFLKKLWLLFLAKRQYVYFMLCHTIRRMQISIPRSSMKWKV